MIRITLGDPAQAAVIGPHALPTTLLLLPRWSRFGNRVRVAVSSTGCVMSLHATPSTALLHALALLLAHLRGALDVWTWNRKAVGRAMSGFHIGMLHQGLRDDCGQSGMLFRRGGTALLQGMRPSCARIKIGITRCASNFASKTPADTHRHRLHS